MSKVFWRILPERHGSTYAEAWESHLAIAEHCGRLKDYHKLAGRPLPPAHARNFACQAFWQTTAIAGKPFEQSPDDTLVMLDADHVMQPDIVQRLAEHKEGVVAALATARGEVPFICAFGKGADGNLYNMSDWEDGELAECVVAGSGAIAIKRWVLYRLQHCAPSWFRYQYGGYPFEATEEMYFGYECAKAGIPHYVDTSLWIPHITTAYTTPDEWRAWYRDNPGVQHKLETPQDMKDLFKPVTGENGNGHEPKGENKWEHIAAVIKPI